MNTGRGLKQHQIQRTRIDKNCFKTATKKEESEMKERKMFGIFWLFSLLIASFFALEAKYFIFLLFSALNNRCFSLAKHLNRLSCGEKSPRTRSVPE